MGKVTLYTKIKENSKHFKEFTKLGVISVSWTTHLEIYEMYLKLINKNNGSIRKRIKSEMIEEIAIEYQMSEVTIYRIIKKMSELV